MREISVPQLDQPVGIAPAGIAENFFNPVCTRAVSELQSGVETEESTRGCSELVVHHAVHQSRKLESACWLVEPLVASSVLSCRVRRSNLNVSFDYSYLSSLNFAFSSDFFTTPSLVTQGDRVVAALGLSRYVGFAVRVSLHDSHFMMEV